MKNRILLSTLIVLQLALIGCETTKGVGRDMKKAGDSIERTAEHND